MKAIIVAIGTEITLGTIVNSNASWISQELSEMGIDVVTHVAIPDNRNLGLATLKTYSQNSELIFVTGGLGPTEDDFTREIVAEWLQLKLEFSDESWDRLSKILQSRNLAVTDDHRRQCYFPVGSKIIQNSEGTADGFYVMKDSVHYWVMPGPPVEVKSIWQNGVHSRLKELLPPKLSQRFYRWHTLGLPEAQVAAIVSPIFQKHNISVGYRIHHPYIETRIEAPEPIDHKYSSLFTELEKALDPYVLLRDEEDLAKNLFVLLRRYSRIKIFDEVSSGILQQRLSSFLADESLEKNEFDVQTIWHRKTEENVVAMNIDSDSSREKEWRTQVTSGDESQLYLSVCTTKEIGVWKIGLHACCVDKAVDKMDWVTKVSKHKLKSERIKLELVELTLKKWKDWLEEI